MIRDPLRKYVNGKVVVIGDAAHVMRPVRHDANSSLYFAPILTFKSSNKAKALQSRSSQLDVWGFSSMESEQMM